MRIFTEPNGYQRVNLSNLLGRKKFYVHRIVATSFIPNPESKPQVNHRDEVKSNNTIDNLEWTTSKENNNHGTRNAKLSTPIEALNAINGAVVHRFPSTREADRKGFDNSAIVKCLRGKRKSHKGLIWRYAN